MYRLLIVDDEEIITDTLHEVLSSKFEAKLEIYKAYSAKEALFLLHNTRIDIILTDIKMPGKSGIELMHDIVKMWPKSKIVFLTGHSEFDYAYTAIKQGNVKFILKTEHYNVVIRTIEQLIHDIDKENELSQIIEYSVAQSMKNNVLEQELILKSLLFEKANLHTNEVALQKKFNYANINLSIEQPVMLVLGKLNISNEKLYSGQDKIYEPIIKYWDMYMQEQFQYAFVKSGPLNIIWLMQLTDEQNFEDIRYISKVIEGNLELVQSNLLEQYNVFVSFTITEQPVAWNMLYPALNRLRSLQSLTLNEQVPLLQIDYSQLHQFDLQLDQIRFLSKLRQFSIWLETGKDDELKQLFDEIERLKSSQLLTVPLFTEIYYTIALSLFSYINKAKLNVKIKEIDYNNLMQLDAHSTTQAAIDYLIEVTTQLCTTINDEEKSRASLVISKICEYIDANLSEDLSLVKLAQVHYFNSSYLSRLFKQECGINISEYIEQRRVLLAKQLLSDPEQKIRDISLKVGYEAAHSFTRFFKKATGMTPQEYRDSIIL